MPVTIEQESDSPLKKVYKSRKRKRYRVSTPKGVKGRGMTLRNAKRQARLLNAVEHGWKPTNTR